MAVVSIRKKNATSRTLHDGCDMRFTKLSEDGQKAALSIIMQDGGLLTIGVSREEFDAVIESYQRACHATTKG